MIDEVVEIDELVTTADEAGETDVIEEIKARIEAEIAAKGLVPGTSSLLPLELPTNDADDRVEFSAEVEQPSDDPTELFRQAKTVPEISAIELPELGEESATADEAAIDAAEPIEASRQSKRSRRPSSLSEPVEPRLTKPTVRTLAELMPPTDDADEIEAAPGPSFDLPNVPLVPNNGATIEFDSSMSFGPAAETEFELDDVDFESMPAEEAIADEPEAAEAAAESEPVFREPKHAESAGRTVRVAGDSPREKEAERRPHLGRSDGGRHRRHDRRRCMPCCISWVPMAMCCKSPSTCPAAVLPKSFAAIRCRSPTRAAHPHRCARRSAEPSETATENESANVPAGYVEETPATPESVAADEPADDDRYGTEPAPLDEPAAEPIAEDAARAPSIPPLPLAGPTFTVNNLATAIEAGKEAQAGLMTGDLNDAAVRRTKGMSYAKLCDLAEALTFVDRSSPSIESDDAIESADRLFRETLSDAHTRAEVARIAQIWIDSPHRSHGGIFSRRQLERRADCRRRL